MAYLTEELAIAGALAGLIYVIALIGYIFRKDPGNEKMRELANFVKEGANAFMRREYLWITPIAVVLAIVIAFIVKPFGLVALGFAIGAGFSAAAGYIGISMTVRSSSRAAEAARHGINDALIVAFRGGSVLGMAVPGLALLGLALFYVFVPNPAAIVGFGFGASLIAMFIRVGGGIYTKAADLGADIAGKIEEGIPEDDPRNPGVIADNVGDNVGDCAGMGSDVYESFIVTALAAILLGSLVFAAGGIFGSPRPDLVAYPLVLGAMGIIGSIAGGLAVRGAQRGKAMIALNRGLYTATILTAILDIIITLYLFSFNMKFAYAMAGAAVLGLIVVNVIETVTDYYTSYRFKPVKDIAEASQTGSATNFLTGFATGLKSAAPIALILIIAIAISYYLGFWASQGSCSANAICGPGVYATSITTMSMLSLTGIILSIDAFGPITDNANGIVEMAGIEGVREVTDELDAIGNTTKATTKGFAIGSAALAALSLFIAYQSEVNNQYILHGVSNPPQYVLSDPYLLIGLLIGGLLPFYFSSFLIGAVGKAGFKMVNEIRRQFNEIPGLREGKAKPDYTKCVDISTSAALRELIAPGLLAILTPIVVGLLLGPVALGGVLIGSVVSGVFLALMMANAGAAWDNAKKYIETGMYGGKGTPTHAAAVSGDTVGDPFKDTAGPSLNSLIKVLNTISIVFVVIFVLLHL